MWKNGIFYNQENPEEKAEFDRYIEYLKTKGIVHNYDGSEL